MLSKIVQNISPSLTLSLQAKANELKKLGRPILNFSAGEPDFKTPANIIKAGKKALDEGFTKYTAPSGILELKEAICRKLLRENKLKYNPENIIIGNGAKQCLYNALLILINPGDEVITHAPYWGSYKEMVELVGGKLVEVNTCKNDFQFLASDFEKAITKKTKVLMLNNPCNPTGAVMDINELQKIARICVKKNIYVISDEVYESFIYDDVKFQSFASLSFQPTLSEPEGRVERGVEKSFSEKLKSLTLTVNAVSKTYSMTGFRIGYIAAGKEIANAMSAIQSHTTSNASSISQKAALAALNGPQYSVVKMVKEYDKRRKYVFEFLSKIPGVKIEKPKGAFYAFIDVSKFFKGKIKNSFDFANELLEKANVMVVPGGAFSKYGEKYIRFSYASSFEDIKVGLNRVKKFLDKL